MKNKTFELLCSLLEELNLTYCKKHLVVYSECQGCPDCRFESNKRYQWLLEKEKKGPQTRRKK